MRLRTVLRAQAEQDDAPLADLQRRPLAHRPQQRPGRPVLLVGAAGLPPPRQLLPQVPLVLLEPPHGSRIAGLHAGVGHVHLHVGTLREAEGFYHRAIGFDKTVWSYPGALFLSAGGYHHHLGTNVWSPGPAPADDDARLLAWSFDRAGPLLTAALAAVALAAASVPLFPRTFLPAFNEGTLTIKDALLYSAVCGTGLDTVPLPGDTTAEQLVPLLLDLSALALRLDKPLTARLMPIPGKKAGDDTNFDFPFFAQSKIMSLDSEKLNSPFDTKEVLQLHKH